VHLGEITVFVLRFALSDPLRARTGNARPVIADARSIAIARVPFVGAIACTILTERFF